MIKQLFSAEKLLTAACLSLALSSCGTISTFQTGKTTPRGQFSFGLGSSGGLLRTKSHQVDYPIELAFANIEVFGGYGLFDFLDVNFRVMAAQFARPAGEGKKELRGVPLFGGGSARFGLVQERWGHPLSIAVGYGYYTGSAQSRQTDLKNTEVKRETTTLADSVQFVHVSRDVVSWLTLYGAYKIYNRRLINRTYEYKILTLNQEFEDKLKGYGAGVSFNVGKLRNTHIMLEINDVRDTDEPARHYQKQAGLGMSVEF